MTKDEALRMALEALDALCINDYSGYELGKRDAHLVDNALTAIKEALAQPKIEKSKEWIGLFDTDEGVLSIANMNCDDKFKFALAIEAKLRSKNND